MSNPGLEERTNVPGRLDLELRPIHSRLRFFRRLIVGWEYSAVYSPIDTTQPQERKEGRVYDLLKEVIPEISRALGQYQPIRALNLDLTNLSEREIKEISDSARDAHIDSILYKPKENI